jgi:hypothetical protein
MSDQPAVNPSRFGARQAQPVDALMGDARDILEGLFSKPDPKDMPMEARIEAERLERIRGIAARKFGDAEGQELLEALCDATVRRPVMIVLPGVKLEDAALYASKREGQNDTLFLLLAWIAAGRSERPPQREGR